MVERVARAVYAENDWWQVLKPEDDGKGRYRDGLDFKLRAVEWEELESDERKDRLSAAIAAITAMREPTEEMETLGTLAFHRAYLERPIAQSVWKAMINRALNHEGKTS